MKYREENTQYCSTYLRICKQTLYLYIEDNYLLNFNSNSLENCGFGLLIFARSSSSF